MNIIWKENPLRSIVEVDERDIERIRVAARSSELYDFIFLAQMYTVEGSKHYKPEKALKLIQEFDYKDIEKNINEEVERYIQDLKDIHIGDCTCVPCTCNKCLAEDAIGINTIEGLGKHAANYISSAFYQEGAEYKSIDQALEYLKYYEVEAFESNKVWQNGKFTKEYYDSWIPKWKADAASAYKWLLNYKETKLK